MATLIVSGAAAMLIAGHPALTSDQVKAKLMKTAWGGFPAKMSIGVTIATVKTYTEYADIFSVGGGLVDLCVIRGTDTILAPNSTPAAESSYHLHRRGSIRRSV